LPLPSRAQITPSDKNRTPTVYPQPTEPAPPVYTLVALKQ
jgi:hypothetical protein